MSMHHRRRHPLSRQLPPARRQAPVPVTGPRPPAGILSRTTSCQRHPATAPPAMGEGPGAGTAVPRSGRVGTAGPRRPPVPIPSRHLAMVARWDGPGAAPHHRVLWP